MPLREIHSMPLRGKKPDPYCLFVSLIEVTISNGIGIKHHEEF